MGHDLYKAYCSDSGKPDLTAEAIAKVLVDLKTRIDGGFSVESVEDGKITLINNRCPFGKKAAGLQSLCMITSSVFGVISSEAAGQANVDIQKSLAAGDTCCRVVVYLNQPEAPGKRYFGRV